MSPESDHFQRGKGWKCEALSMLSMLEVGSGGEYLKFSAWRAQEQACKLSVV